MAELGSFVFFDLETTGLPGIKFPKITEISLIACSRNHLLSCHESKQELPRVLHKQTICVNPRRIIDVKASETTGLYNDLLEHEAEFDDKAVQLIGLFLERLQRPACLVAHNGNRFDFVILKKELEALHFKLPEDVYCVDSLVLFKHLETEKEQNKNVAVQHKKVAEENELADLEFSAITAMQELDSSQDALAKMQKLNEMTPQKSKIQVNFKQALRSYLDVTPSQEAESSGTGTKRTSPPHSRRQLFTNGEGEPNPKNLGKSVRKKFRLCDVYERVFKEPPKQSHYAESDVEALLKCAIAEGQAFVAYAEKHCVKFVDFKGKF
ncbi:uncharacterized protein LOC129723922 [Wyeomyia smithii]|uniref:uncharacterized protein LOC129723922 n=1 Tax=Wyeomyia smithii TaxID=174621 RepID=UPI0024681B9F|nr:uncharacterized protein LOC129723922 [Wyeomyia smithii]